MVLILGIVLISLIINPLINNCYAQSPTTTIVPTLKQTTESLVCFKEEDAKKMVVELENARDYEDEIDLLKKGNLEIEKQITLLKEANKLQNEQLDISKKTIDSYKELLQAQKDAYEKKIENEKPSIWGKFFAAIGGVGIGVLIGLLL